MKVNVMKPAYKPRKYESYVLYPYHIFHIQLHYKRLGMRDKIINYFGYVDLYRFGVERGDSFIDTEEWDVVEKNVMEPMVTDYEKIKEFAMKKAVEWAGIRITSWWHPLVKVVKDKRAYKIFWIYKKGDDIFFMDSLLGHEYSLKQVEKIMSKREK